MPSFGNLFASLTLESASFMSGMKAARKGLAETQRSFAKTGAKLTDIGAKMSIGITAPLTAFGTLAFNAASDAAELQSAFNETFGSMAGGMTEWARVTGDAMGRSTQELQRAANAFGMFFNQAAPTKQAAAELSQQFTVLAQDLSSFFNVSTEDALAKLRSGLSGESEPLRDFGVFLSEAAVSAKAMEMGLSGVGNELTEQEKILARAAVIMEQTKTAQGDVARTAGGTANQVRAAAAAFEELQVTVGTKLLPVITPLIAKVADALNWFTQLPAPVQTAAVAIGAVGTALGPVLLGFGGIVSGVGTALPYLVKFGGFFTTTLIPVLAATGRALVGLAIAGGPLTLVVAGVTAAFVAWQNWDKIGPLVGRMVSSVKSWLMDTLGGAFTWLKGKIEAVAGWFKWLDDVVVRHSYIPDMVDSIGQHIRRLKGEMVDPAQAANEAVAKSFANMAQQVSGTISSLASSIKSGDWGSALGGVLDLAQQIGGIFGGKVDVAGARNGANAALAGLSGARALGGPVMPRGSYLVGERGPEILRMGGRGGSIVPNHQIGGGAVVQLVVGEGQMFEPRVAGISGNVSVETVRSSNRTAALRGRQRLA